MIPFQITKTNTRVNKNEIQQYKKLVVKTLKV